MSPRHDPTYVFLCDRPRVVGSQSRSQFAGFGRRVGQVFFRTRQSTNAGPNELPACPMQLMFPEGDWKWTSGGGGAARASATKAAASMRALYSPVVVRSPRWRDQ